MSFQLGIVAWIPKPSLRGGVVAWTGKCSLCHSRGGGNPEKKYKYSKFLKLKDRFISLYAGFPPTRE
ncbi:MAG TPA: hypothetical protein LFV92_03750 [Rickettsia endosymbiont of Ceroptres masudai]|nr:hypothetical protein [Rickettsia endosymbiont of Ceroptres masudai]